MSLFNLRELAGQAEQYQRERAKRQADEVLKYEADPRIAVALLREIGLKNRFTVTCDEKVKLLTDQGKYQAADVNINAESGHILLIVSYAFASGKQEYQGFDGRLANAITEEDVTCSLGNALLHLAGKENEIAIDEDAPFCPNTGRKMNKGEIRPPAFSHARFSAVSGMPIHNLRTGVVQIQKPGSQEWLDVSSYEAEQLSQKGWVAGAVAKDIKG